MNPTVQQQKLEALKAVLKRIGTDPVITEHLPKARIMLRGGRWWKQARAHIDEADQMYLDLVWCPGGSAPNKMNLTLPYQQVGMILVPRHSIYLKRRKYA